MDETRQQMVPHEADTSMVFVTRLKVRSFRDLPAFLRASLAVSAEAARSHGFAGGRLGVDLSGAFWTLTVWRDQQAMHAFGRSAVHREAMRHTHQWARQASNMGWPQPTRRLPSWDEAYDRMASDGRSYLPDTTLVDPRRRPRTVGLIARRPRGPRRRRRTGLDAGRPGQRTGLARRAT